MKQKIAACMILGDQYDQSELSRTFRSIEDAGIDALFIAYNGKNPMQSLDWIKSVISIPYAIQLFEWEENFALARSQSFEMALRNKDEFDWIMWIDCDDIFVVERDLQDILADVKDHHAGIFLRYDYAIEPETRQVIVEQWRERILRTSVKWEWVHPIHEVCLGPPNASFVRMEGAHIEHLRTSGEDRGARKRNRKIIAKAMREHPEVARYVFYFAGETMAEADSTTDPIERANLAHAAIHAFDRFKNMLDAVNDDYFIAQVRIAECFRMCGEWMEALDADLETIAIYPSWPDGFIGAAKTCMELGDFTRMLGFADIATKIPKPRTHASIESMNSTFTPLFLRGIANEHLGNFQQAIDDYEAASKFWTPPNDKLPEKIKELKKILVEGVPEDKSQNDRQKLRGSKPDKSIAFVTTPIPEDWHPELMKINGSGGAELCIMKLAPMFAADGWRVAVFGTPGEYRGVYEQDGVEYWHSMDYDPSERFKILVSSRTAAPFGTELNVDKKYLWMHDVNIGPDLSKVIDIPDKILGLTPWHVKHLSKLYGVDPSRFAIIPNGIDLDRFPKASAQRTELEPKFIWSSSYDRGLETILGLWPHVKEMLPEATLDVFYGWNMYEKSIEQWRGINPAQAQSLQDFRDKIEGQIEWLSENGYSGVSEHGRVSQEALAVCMNDSHIWPYTTQFMETFCITAIEMQAAGVIPIASKLAALNDNIAIKELLIEGWPQNVSYQNQFLGVLASAFEAPADDILSARQKGRRLAESMTWENSYTKWNDLFKNS